jgi:glyoxylase-like metal-dependent hydrolase (beta-lactamase superfamily II)
MAGLIRSKGYEPAWVALTHGHGDHILGSTAFAGAEVYAHDRTQQVISRQVAGLAGKRDERPEQVEATLPWPTVTFSHELTVDLGEMLVRMFHTPGHSEDGACVLVEPQGILFGGDTVVTCIVPAITDGNSRDLERSLRRLAQMEFETLVPGHGSVVRGRDQIRGWLQFWIDYLAGVRSAAHLGLIRGDAPEAVIDSIRYDTYVGTRLPAEPYGMHKRHRATVSKIVQEELATLESAIGSGCERGATEHGRN